MPNQDRLRELFEYDGKRGVLLWRTKKGTAMAGDVAGCTKLKGYVYISIDGKDFAAHRLIWIWANGDIPSGVQIDHINRNPEDNRLENLRKATHNQNAQNKNRLPNNTSGQTGVVWHKNQKKWLAVIKFMGKRIYLGSFEKFDDAVAARLAAERKYHGDFAQSAALEDGNATKQD